MVTKAGGLMKMATGLLGKSKGASKAVSKAKPKLSRQNAMKLDRGAKPASPVSQPLYMDSKGVGHTKPKSTGKPDNLPQRPWEDINTIFDSKTDQFTPLSAKKADKLRRKSGGASPVAANGKLGAPAEPQKKSWWSSDLVQTIGGTVAGTLGVSALTSMFSGGGASAEAAADPAATASTAASSYDPYASSGSYGIPGSIPSYI